MSPKEYPTCKTCGLEMLEIGSLGVSRQIGEMRKVEGSEHEQWFQTGVTGVKLYQCSVDKTIVIY